MSRSTIRAGVAATLLVASFAVAQAQQPMQRVQVGILECRGGASVGFIVGSVTNLVSIAAGLESLELRPGR